MGFRRVSFVSLRVPESPIPTPTLPLKGREESALRDIRIDRL